MIGAEGKGSKPHHAPATTAGTKQPRQIARKKKWAGVLPGRMLWPRPLVQGPACAFVMPFAALIPSYLAEPPLIGIVAPQPATG